MLRQSLEELKWKIESSQIHFRMYYSFFQNWIIFYWFSNNDSYIYLRNNVSENIDNVWIAYESNKPVECIDYRVKSANTSEVKRLFVKKEYRD